MRILQINSVCGTGSTGRIVVAIDDLLKKQGHDSLVAYGRGSPRHCRTAIRVGSKLDTYVHAAISRLFDMHCYGSRGPTKVLVGKIEEFKPDIVHLHNIHGYYANMETLFDYLREADMPVIWTLHDCWPFTGHCAYFDYVGCTKWKKGCHDCPQKHQYPSSFSVDRSERNYRDKKRLFTQVRNMTIVTPSNWLAGLASSSFLGKYSIRVINNGVDQSVFRPRPSSFRERYGLKDKFVVLGLASVWERRKGFEYFLKLSRHLSEDVAIVMVGVTKRQLASLPDRITGIERTSNADELAEVYSAADVFVNPTLEENFPTTNLESLACGTPIITFRTGGSVESVDGCGLIVEKGDLNGLIEGIRLVRERTKLFYSDRALSRAALLYRDHDRFQEYIELYEQVISVDSSSGGSSCVSQKRIKDSSNI